MKDEQRIILAAPGSIRPEIAPPAVVEFLLRTYRLPLERRPEVERLLATQASGGTAVALAPGVPAEPAAWGAAARSASAGAGAPTPLVIERESGTAESAGVGRLWLQSWRYYAAERAIAAALRERAAQVVAASVVHDEAELMRAWGLNAAQAKALQAALERRLALITGGPGTGKTHTLARLLAALIPQDGRVPVFRLAAPTGKAADRMRQAILQALERLPEDQARRVAEPLARAAREAGTLHKLLGHNPLTGLCAHDARRPLAAEVVIVDECSMVDTLLWQALLAALRPDTRLVLLGDPHQLESVSAGDVLGAIVRRIKKVGARSALTSCWVELTESRRFRDQPAIGELARAVTSGEPEAALAVLRAGADCLARQAFAGGAAGLGEPAALGWATLPDSVRVAIFAVAEAATPAEALAALERVRLLTAHRDGRTGAAGVNAWINRELATRLGAVGWFAPVIINRNDAETGLKNGSVGVRREGPGGVRLAWFPAELVGAAPNEIELARLPAEQAPAWAMTIHRSQGSEFDQVGVVLPGESTSPLATRELLYTAITRAKQAVYVWGAEPVIRRALADRTPRPTRLEARLAESDGG